MEKYLGKLIEDYNRALTEEIGEGKLKNRLVEGLKDIFNVDALNFILNEYSQGTLKKELSDGDLQKRLFGKLEEILNGNNLGKKTNKNLQNNSGLNLDEEINGENLNDRIYNCLKYRSEIRTYKDLIKYCYEMSQEFPEHSKSNYLDYGLLRIRKFGKKSLYNLKEHLKSRNFDFSEEFARKVVEKSKESC